MCTVTLNVFSGRTNPTWELANTEAEYLLLQVQELSVPATRRPKIPDLGYRGMTVSCEARAEIHVFGGVITSEANMWLDSERGLEKWLLSTAGKLLNESLLQMVTEQMTTSDGAR